MSEKRDKLERFFRIDGTNPVLALDLANACIEENDFDRARDVLEQVCHGSPLATAHANEFGLLYGRMGEWGLAVDVLEEAVSKDPTAAELRFNLGYAQLCNDSPEAAKESFNEAVRLRPEDPRFHFFHGLAAYDSDSHAEARAAFENVLRLEPENDEASALLGAIALESGDAAQAHAQADRLIGSKTPFGGLWLKAQLASLEFEFEEALTWLEKAEQIEPENPDVLLLKGQILLGLQRTDEATRAFTRAVANNDSSLAWTGLGWCAVMQDNQSTAADAFARAVEADPESAEGYVGLALLQMATGQHEAAREHLSRALKLNPNHPLALALKASKENGENFALANDQVRAALEEYRITPGYKINILHKLKNSKLIGRRPKGST